MQEQAAAGARGLANDELPRAQRQVRPSLTTGRQTPLYSEGAAASSPSYLVVAATLDYWPDTTLPRVGRHSRVIWTDSGSNIRPPDLVRMIRTIFLLALVRRRPQRRSGWAGRRHRRLASIADGPRRTMTLA